MRFIAGRTLMKTWRLVIITTLFFITSCNIFGQNLSKSKADKVWQMLENGKTEESFWYLVELYKENGADVEIGGKSGLKLKVQDYKEIINKYSNGQVEIHLSRMMKPEETADYWENWSKTLAEGNFDHQKFFKNDRERFLFANFNVLVLAAHEIGHYLDFRYLINDRFFESGMLTTKAPMNCVENYADKFAVATINYLAQDPRIAEIRPRYLELIKTFNSSIPTQNRYNWDAYEFVGEKCGEVDLYKNGVTEDGNGVNENFFRQYTSAYFNRHRLMLENKNYPNLQNVIKQDLLESFYKTANLSEAKLKVKTISELNIKHNNDIFFGGDDLREMIGFNRDLSSLHTPQKDVSVSRKTNVLNDKGELRTLEFNWIAKDLLYDDEKIILKENGFTLNLLNDEEKLIGAVKVSIPKRLHHEFVISKVVLPTDNEIVVILTPFDLAKKFDYVVVLQLFKEKQKWKEKFVKFTLPDLKNADEIVESWFVTPKGKLNLLRRTIKADGNVDLTQYEIDRKNFTATLKREVFTSKMKNVKANQSRKNGLWLFYTWNETLSGNDSGKLIVEGSEFDANFISNSSKDSLFEVGEMGKTLLSSFSGIVDGENQREIRISNIGATRFISKNRLVLIDYHDGKAYLREIIFE